MERQVLRDGQRRHRTAEQRLDHLVGDGRQAPQVISKPPRRMSRPAKASALHALAREHPILDAQLRAAQQVVGLDAALGMRADDAEQREMRAGERREHRRLLAALLVLAGLGLAVERARMPAHRPEDAEVEHQLELRLVGDLHLVVLPAEAERARLLAAETAGCGARRRSGCARGWRDRPRSCWCSRVDAHGPLIPSDAAVSRMPCQASRVSGTPETVRAARRWFSGSPGTRTGVSVTAGAQDFTQAT
jgi:hypothetical protein